MLPRACGFLLAFEIVIEEDEEVSRGLDWTAGGDLQRRSCRVLMIGL